MRRPTHHRAGQTVMFHGQEFHIEDWWINVFGDSWMNATGNFAVLEYAARSASANLPTDDEVLYGKIGGLGLLVHTSEIGGEQSE